MVMNPLDKRKFVVNRFRVPTAEENRPAHGLAIFLRSIVRKEQTPPCILRFLPVTACPAHQHDARGANLLAWMQTKMCLKHSAGNGDDFSILGIIEVGLPASRPSNGFDKSMIAGLQIEER